jgi:hypothetical protein
MEDVGFARSVGVFKKSGEATSSELWLVIPLSFLFKTNCAVCPWTTNALTFSC